MEIKRNQVYEADCVEILQSLPSMSADLVIEIGRAHV